ncbi:MAG: hypothetical protein IJ512_01540 [Ruminococcus sp.]|nr:hypothetical protein [Ruminococcus sp.]
MYEMERFIQAALLLLVLTLLSVFSAVHFSLLLLLSGLLMILFTLRSLSGSGCKLLFGTQILLSAGFALLSGNFLSCLIGYECRWGKYKWMQLLLPLLFGIPQTVIQNTALPQLLWRLLLLFGAGCLFRLAEHLLLSYLSARDQIAKAVSVTAVNEMYEKKLNQELVQKHYLAEKNARLEERETISRNIHNSVGHSITAAIMTLDAADLLFEASPEKAREKMNLANERIRTSLASIRHAVRVLDEQAPNVGMKDLIRQLHDAAERFMMDTTIQVRTDFTDAEEQLSIPHEHAEFLTGALQELLTNGVRHGHADRFLAGLHADSRHIRLHVTDNGRSDFSEENRHMRIQNGFGLKKLISYAKRCGGTAVFTNENGFCADITLPLLKEENHE